MDHFVDVLLNFVEGSINQSGIKMTCFYQVLVLINQV